MKEVIKIIEQTCLSFHDSGETSVTREARLIIEALKKAGFCIIDRRNALNKELAFPTNINWPEFISKTEMNNSQLEFCKNNEEIDFINDKFRGEGFIIPFYLIEEVKILK